MSPFTHPQVVPNLYDFFFFCWMQKKIFWRGWKKYYGSQWGPSTVWSL